MQYLMHYRYHILKCLKMQVILVILLIIGESGDVVWGRSNIRQWLNSAEPAGKWYSAQHENDMPPILSEDTYSSSQVISGSFANDPGFLAGFNLEFISHLTEVKNVTIDPFISTSTEANPVGVGVGNITYDKVFLPSYTEMTGTPNYIGYATNMSTGVVYKTELMEGKHL